MVQSAATTVAQYLEELPADRREMIAAVRETVLAHLPEGYEEAMNWGMISYEIPLARYPKTDNGQPLAYVALASQKNYCSLYLMGVYADSDLARRLEASYAERGQKLDMGKCCLRFKRLDELPLDLVGEIVAATSVEATIARYELSRAR
jgi:Domain of unknown function (DU1801)